MTIILFFIKIALRFSIKYLLQFKYFIYYMTLKNKIKLISF